MTQTFSNNPISKTDSLAKMAGLEMAWMLMLAVPTTAMKSVLKNKRCLSGLPRILHAWAE